MSDPVSSPTVTPPATTAAPRGYFNQAQIEDLDQAEIILAAYRGSEGEQQDTIRDKEVTRLDRDQLIHVLNTRRSSIQHAADALWPWSSEANRPIRKTFALPLNRPLGM